MGLAGSDPGEQVRGNALILLRTRMDDAAVVELMLARASAERSSENRKEAVRALGHNGLRENARVLDALLAISASDPSEEVRRLAQKSLASLKSPR